MRSMVITAMLHGSVVGLGRGQHHRRDGSGGEYDKLHAVLSVLRKIRSSMESSEEGESDEMLAKMSEGTACKECSRSTSTKRR